MAYTSSGQTWTEAYCQTQVDLSSEEIICSCSILDSIYFGVFTDFSRQEASTDSSTDYLEVDHSFAFLSVVVILLVFSVIIPVILIVLDKKELRLAQKLQKTQNNQLLRILSKLSKKPTGYWAYKHEEINEYKLESRTLFAHLLS